jgi:hypothetical protein
VIREEIEQEPEIELPLRLVLEVDEPCWLEVRADGIVSVRGLMLRGFHKEIQAREEIRLWLGNSGGVSIWINETPGLPLGRPGQVRKDIRITPKNYGEFVVPEDSSVGSPAASETGVGVTGR